MMPGVQLVNMRPNAPAPQNKTVSPRVVINPHMVSTRPANPGVSDMKMEIILNDMLFFIQT